MSMQYQKKAQKSGGGLFSGFASLFSKSKDAAKPESKPKKQEKPSELYQEFGMMDCAMESNDMMQEL
jgi:hypothetical protein